MSRGIQGTFVIAWSQIEVDGMSDLRPKDLIKGAAWTWNGDAVRVDGPAAILRLGDPDWEEDNRRRAAKAVKKLVGAVTENRPLDQVTTDVHLGDADILLTDGRATFTMTVIDVPNGEPLVMFVDELPRQNAPLWVVERGAETSAPHMPEIAKTGGIICFTENTFIGTPTGFTRVGALRPGDMLQTRDNGPQPVLWVGHRRMSGARLHVMPQMRPIRIKGGAFSPQSPAADMLVSPNHRMVVKGQVALDLYNTDEVLVAAKDLINGRSIYPEIRCREVTYFHVLLESHEVLWANGMLTESFHPAHTNLTAIEDEQRQNLYGLFPNLEWSPEEYGDDVRRVLTPSEAAILKFG